jgi:hypothetical protein
LATVSRVAELLKLAKRDALVHNIVFGDQYTDLPVGGGAGLCSAR